MTRSKRQRFRLAVAAAAVAGVSVLGSAGSAAAGGASLEWRMNPALGYTAVAPASPYGIGTGAGYGPAFEGSLLVRTAAPVEPGLRPPDYPVGMKYDDSGWPEYMASGYAAMVFGGPVYWTGTGAGYGPVFGGSLPVQMVVPVNADREMQERLDALLREKYGGVLNRGNMDRFLKDMMREALQVYGKAEERIGFDCLRADAAVRSLVSGEIDYVNMIPVEDACPCCCPCPSPPCPRPWPWIATSMGAAGGWAAPGTKVADPETGAMTMTVARMPDHRWGATVQRLVAGGIDDMSSGGSCPCPLPWPTGPLPCPTPQPWIDGTAPGWWGGMPVSKFRAALDWAADDDDEDPPFPVPIPGVGETGHGLTASGTTGFHTVPGWGFGMAAPEFRAADDDDEDPPFPIPIPGVG